MSTVINNRELKNSEKIFLKEKNVETKGEIPDLFNSFSDFFGIELYKFKLWGWKINFHKDKIILVKGVVLQ